MGTPPFGVAFAETRDATERLIARGLVRGKRFSGADGIYFNELKLTPKGERMAIQHRTTAAENKQALAEAIKDANSVVADIEKFEGKKSHED